MKKGSLNKTLPSLMRGVAIMGIGMLALIVGLIMAGARLNTSKSLPIGLYWTSRKPIEKGTYVLFCPPQREEFDEAKKRGYIGAGPCPGGYGLMMKRVLAAPGDVVSVTDQGVVVNDEVLPHSKPLTVDRGGRPLPCYRVAHYTLGTSEMMLMSDVSAISFDSRYFGPLTRARIKTALFPLLTW